MEREGMFKELVENLADVIVVTDKSFIIRYVSSSINTVFGIGPVAVLGKNVFDFISPEKKASWSACLDGNPVNETLTITRRSGQVLHFDVYISSLLHHQPVQGLAITLHNITPEKERADELMRSNLQLDQVIFKTTHDLKAPVASALGLVKLAEHANDHERKEYLRLIKRSLLKMDDLINEMNNFFRNDKLAVGRERIDVQALLKDEIENLSLLYQEKNIELTFSVDDSSEFYSDKVRVKTIVTNILSNAIKYYDPHKKLPFINISVLINKDICVVRMEDNGIGIDPEYQEKIFDLFFRATEQSDGTGLGLFIVKDTVEKLGGTIAVQSVLQEGTTFVITIPNTIHQPVALESRG